MIFLGLPPKKSPKWNAILNIIYMQGWQIAIPAMKETTMTIELARVIIKTASLKTKQNNQVPSSEQARLAFQYLVNNALVEEYPTYNNIQNGLFADVLVSSDEQTLFKNVENSDIPRIKEIIQDIWSAGDFWKLGILYEIDDLHEDFASNRVNSMQLLIRKTDRLSKLTREESLIETVKKFQDAYEEYAMVLNRLTDSIN